MMMFDLVADVVVDGFQPGGRSNSTASEVGELITVEVEAEEAVAVAVGQLWRAR